MTPRERILSVYRNEVPDQVPPGAEEKRIEIMRDLVETNGKY
jgi:hypothetical protein